MPFPVLPLELPPALVQEVKPSEESASGVIVASNAPDVVPGAVDASAVDSPAVESSVVGSGAVDPGAVDPSVPNPSAVDSGAVDSGLVDSGAVDPSPSAPAIGLPYWHRLGTRRPVRLRSFQAQDEQYRRAEVLDDATGAENAVDPSATSEWVLKPLTSDQLFGLGQLTPRSPLGSAPNRRPAHAAHGGQPSSRSGDRSGPARPQSNQPASPALPSGRGVDRRFSPGPTASRPDSTTSAEPTFIEVHGIQDLELRAGPTPSTPQPRNDPFPNVPAVEPNVEPTNVEPNSLPSPPSSLTPESGSPTPTEPSGQPSRQPSNPSDRPSSPGPSDRPGRDSNAEGQPGSTEPSPGTIDPTTGPTPTRRVQTTPDLDTPTSTTPTTTAEPEPIEPPNPDLPLGLAAVMEVRADRQEFDRRHQIFLAEGNASLRYKGALIEGDRLRVNLIDRLVIAEGHVSFTRGRQTLRSDRLEFNLLQGDGTATNVYGTIFRPTTGADLSPTRVEVSDYNPALDRPLSDRISSQQTLREIRQIGQFGFGSDGSTTTPPGQTNDVNNLRFQADHLDFDSRGWLATNARITNDPFSPPELEIRADQLRLRRLSPLRDELSGTYGRLVLDQTKEIPLPISRGVLDRRERLAPPLEIGYEGDDDGGVFIQRRFPIIQTDDIRFDVAPRLMIQRAIFGDGGPFKLSSLGFRGRFNARLSPTTSFAVLVNASSLDPNQWDKRLRASARLNQLIPTGWGTHTLTVEASYRDRLFNGSIGYQTVQRSLGVLLTSPAIPLGGSGVILNYQAGFQNINAETDRPDLLAPVRDNNRITLNRGQASVTFTRPWVLWQGEALPPTAEEGLRYSPVPVRPVVRLIGSVQGLLSRYSSGDVQDSINTTIALQAQFGHFSQPVFDYTALNIAYLRRFRQGLSPFLFDRIAEDRIMAVGLTQQIYGPFRFSLQKVLSLDTGRTIETNYLLEYSRRTHGILIRFNPERQLGSIILRISDFNWTGNGEAFDDYLP